jgi:hypothetical protein
MYAGSPDPQRSGLAPLKTGNARKTAGDTFEERWYRVQGDAGTATPFNNAINPGRLHASDHARQTECTSRCHVVGLLFSAKT